MGGKNDRGRKTESILGKLRAELGSAVTLKIFTKYVTQEATEEEARRINTQSRTALGAVPDMVQFHWCVACRPTQP